MSIVSTTRMTARQFLQLGQDPPGVLHLPPFDDLAIPLGELWQPE